MANLRVLLGGKERFVGVLGFPPKKEILITRYSSVSVALGQLKEQMAKDRLFAKRLPRLKTDSRSEKFICLDTTPLPSRRDLSETKMGWCYNPRPISEMLAIVSRHAAWRKIPNPRTHSTGNASKDQEVFSAPHELSPLPWRAGTA